MLNFYLKNYYKVIIALSALKTLYNQLNSFLKSNYLLFQILKSLFWHLIYFILIIIKVNII